MTIYLYVPKTYHRRNVYLHRDRGPGNPATIRAFPRHMPFARNLLYIAEAATERRVRLLTSRVRLFVPAVWKNPRRRPAAIVHGGVAPAAAEKNAREMVVAAATSGDDRCGRWKWPGFRLHGGGRGESFGRSAGDRRRPRYAHTVVVPPSNQPRQYSLSVCSSITRNIRRTHRGRRLFNTINNNNNY